MLQQHVKNDVRREEQTVTCNVSFELGEMELTVRHSFFYSAIPY